ncbi:MAG: hypothetical protein Q3Y08_00810, partial [Butyricicoccus sp.]|nr:hypothetical protein [Butyricicoccus sp.]
MQENTETPSVKRSFAERHPKLNLLLGLFLLLIFLAAALWLLQYTGNLIKDSLNWMLTTVRKLDAVVIVALITGAVSIVGVVISSVIAKFIEYKKNRQNYLTQKRETPYGEFVDMIYKVLETTKNKGS